MRQGLAITGETKITRDLQALSAYYGDLVTEIQLRTSIEGPSDVGHSAPFGLRVDLRHTAEIERESGGFSKYLQNQNSQNYAYNCGRAPARGLPRQVRRGGAVRRCASVSTCCR